MWRKGERGEELETKIFRFKSIGSESLRRLGDVKVHQATIGS